MIVLLHNLSGTILPCCGGLGSFALLQACRDNKIVMGQLVSLVVDQKSCDL